MKKALFNFFILIFLIIFLAITILSTVGYETNKFSEIISRKINESNKNVKLELDKIKFKFDLKDLSLFLITKKPEISYQELNLPLKDIKVYINLISLLKSKININKINVSSEEINIDQLKKIIIRTKPSNLNSLIVNKIKNGKLNANIELYFGENFTVTNYIAKGNAKALNISIKDNLNLSDTNFSFFADSTDILITNVTSNANGILFKDGNLQIERNEYTIVKSNFISDININKNNFENYSEYLKNFEYLNKDLVFKANINHNFNITFNDTFKITNYLYTNSGNIDELLIKPSKPLEVAMLEDKIKNFKLKETSVNLRYGSDKNNNYILKGKYSLNNESYLKYNFKNTFLNNTLNLNGDFEFDKEIKLDFINYKKIKGKIAKINSNITIKGDQLDLNKVKYTEGESIVTIENLKLNKENISSLKKIKIKTFEKNKLNNDFTINFGKKVRIYGNRYDAKNLSRFLNKKTENNSLKKISKNIEIDFTNISTPLSKNLKNFKLIGSIKKGKFIKISSKGDFGDNKFLDISLKSDENNEKKYLEIYSDLPQPLLAEYSFFKGLSGGILTFSTIIEKDTSSSKIIIDNFKIINAPGVIKLLSLADFGGLADLAEGEGLSFDKLEINTIQNKGFMKIEELYAVGPSISVLMDGYKEVNGLTSLRGTLVPAKNLNKLISKIPVIGKIVIPKEVGEGLFGVSFKMKGFPGDIKTTINPIKTLTPRFITRAMEKARKSK